MDSIPNAVADPDWIKERWGGFTYLDIARTEDFMLDFKDDCLWLHFERNANESQVARVLLFENPTRQDVSDAERIFGCR